jgi:hypothetical protein
MEHKLNQGDIIYANCSEYTLCYHLGIIYDDGKNKLVYHNDPTNKNKYGGTVCAEKYEDFIKKRNVIKVVRTNARNNDILRVAIKSKHEVWDELFFNCEDFVHEIVEGERNSDLRNAYILLALGVTALILI